MQLVIHDVEHTAPIILHPRRMTDAKFFDFCARYPDHRIERTARGQIVIMPPAGLETGFRNNDLARQLGNWAREDGRGRAFDSNTEYLVPSGAGLAPDASWVSREKLAGLDPESKRRFPRLTPEFIVELMSPSDRLPAAKRRMVEWIEAGVELGWLLHPGRRTAYVYRPRRAPEKLVAPKKLKGQGPVSGFVLDLTEIWEPNL